MSGLAKWTRNSMTLLVSQVVSRGGTFVLTIILARMLGESVLGEFAALYAVFSILFPVAEWGQQTYLTRVLATEDRFDRQQILSSLVVSGGFSGIAGLLMLLTGSLVIVENFMASLWLSFSLVLMTLSHVLKAVFRARDKWHLESAASFVDRFFMLLVALLFICLDYGIEGVCLAIFCGQLLAFIYVLHKIRREYEPGWREESFSVVGSNNLKSGFSLMLTGLFAILYVKSDLVILSLFKSENEVGSYAAAYNLILIASVLPYVFLWSYFPGLSAMNTKSIYRWNHRSLMYMAVLALVLFTAANVLKQPLYMLVYGTCGGIMFLPLLFAAEGVNYLNYTMGLTRRALNQEKLLAILMGTGALLNIILNLFMIPSMGAEGAALSTFATYVMVALGNIILLGQRRILYIAILIVLGSMLLLWGIYGYTIDAGCF